MRQRKSLGTFPAVSCTSTGTRGRCAPDDAERVDARQEEERERQREDGVHREADLHAPAGLSAAFRVTIKGRATLTLLYELKRRGGRGHMCMQEVGQVWRELTSTVAT